MKSAPPDEDSASGVRLQRYLAMAGVGARRQCEDLIATGRVSVDGKTVTELGAKVEPGQDVRLDGERVRLERRVYWLLNKPPGVLCTSRDPEGRPLAISLIPRSRERLFTVGRLDEHSQGLLLITNDGELAHRLAHPRFRVHKVYRVQVQGVPTRETIVALKKGVYFPEGKFKAVDVRLKKSRETSALIDVTLAEGQNREIRRMLARLGHKVQRLTRIALGELQLGDLPLGAYRPLSPTELKGLQALTGRKRSSKGRTEQSSRRQPPARPRAKSGPKSRQQSSAASDEGHG